MGRHGNDFLPGSFEWRTKKRSGGKAIEEVMHHRIANKYYNSNRACSDICPIGVYGDLDEDKKITFRDQHACFACSACAKQCREGALFLR